jgi:hypothetical protein
MDLQFCSASLAHYGTLVGIFFGTFSGQLWSTVLWFHIGHIGDAFGSGYCGLVDVSLILLGTWFGF